MKSDKNTDLRTAREYALEVMRKLGADRPTYSLVDHDRHVGPPLKRKSNTNWALFTFTFSFVLDEGEAWERDATLVVKVNQISTSGTKPKTTVLEYRMSTSVFQDPGFNGEGMSIPARKLTFIVDPAGGKFALRQKAKQPKPA